MRAGNVIQSQSKLAACHIIIIQLVITGAASPVPLKAQDSPLVGLLSLARVLLAIHDNLGAALAPVLLFDHIHDAWDVLG